MVFLFFGALAPSIRSLLSLALMPLTLLMACALVAGMGALILLFSRSAQNAQPAPRVPLSAPQLSPAEETAPMPLIDSERRAASGFVERRRGASTPEAPAPAAASEARADSHTPPSAVLTRAEEKTLTSEPNHHPALALERRATDAPPPAGPFQPAARFSRSQQAFLRLPVVLSWQNESGIRFREETCTLILLPQGAVLPIAERLSPGAALMLTFVGKEPVACSVFGAQTGPDGKSLIEIEFSVPHKFFWPVSFPAWSGELPAHPERRGSSAPARGGHTAVLNEAGS